MPAPSRPELPHLTSRLERLRKVVAEKRQRNTTLSHALISASLPPDPPPAHVSAATSTLNLLHATILPPLSSYTATLSSTLLSLQHCRIHLLLCSFDLQVLPHRSILSFPLHPLSTPPLLKLAYHHLLSLLSLLSPYLSCPPPPLLPSPPDSYPAVLSPDGERHSLDTEEGKDLLGFYVMLSCSQAGCVDGLGGGTDFIGNLWALQNFCAKRI
ncbi:hypothetical protein TeGR_g7528 [Tetraparma gracilis]|uniref:Uncharacterized protein n=1 Tax=Tetraparma gracilis TaxID=2962635 RepID=A0ABQ6MFJ5_9STRA|nr:hypothetical protein TeGR_g7528 [Tetraparma gracilis]